MFFLPRRRPENFHQIVNVQCVLVFLRLSLGAGFSIVSGGIVYNFCSSSSGSPSPAIKRIATGAGRRKVSVYTLVIGQY